MRRYFDAFPRERIFVFLFDDLKVDQAGLVRDIYRFLGAYEGFVPDLDTPHNIGGMPANMLLERVFTNDSLGRAVDPWIPKRAADWARRRRTRNLRRAPRLPRELATELRERFRDDIGKTAELIGRDLSLRLDR